ncbi:hypothetical protein CN141_07730, partial [Sinorhizobium meliloti]
MMKEIDISYRAMFAELTQRTLDAQFAADFPLEAGLSHMSDKRSEELVIPARLFDFPADGGLVGV